MRRSGLQPDGMNFNAVINAFRNTADIAGAENLLEEMKGAGAQARRGDAFLRKIRCMHTHIYPTWILRVHYCFSVNVVVHDILLVDFAELV